MKPQNPAGASPIRVAGCADAAKKVLANRTIKIIKAIVFFLTYFHLLLTE
jgi:hypothetical protein